MSSKRASGCIFFYEFFRNIFSAGCCDFCGNLQCKNAKRNKEMFGLPADDNKNRQLTRVARYIVANVVVVVTTAVAFVAVVTDNLMWHIKQKRAGSSCASISMYGLHWVTTHPQQQQ